MRELVGLTSASLRRLIDRGETILFLTGSDLKSRHRDKVLGNFWSLLDPFLFVAVYFLVFGVLFGQTSRGRSGEFLVYLVIGVLAWRFLDSALQESASCLRGNRGLIHGANFPRAVFPLSVCLARLHDFGWGLVVFGGALLLTRVPLSLHLLWAPVLVGVQLLFVTGCSLVTADLGAFYADTSNIVRVLTRVWFYLSPVIYQIAGDSAIVPERYLWIFMLNPVACLLEGYRNAFLWGRMPDVDSLLYALGVSLAAVAVGVGLFAYHDGEFAKHV